MTILRHRSAFALIGIFGLGSSVCLPVSGQKDSGGSNLGQERFNEWDKDGDGKLTAAEVTNEKLFARMDANSDGAVTADEATRFVAKNQRRKTAPAADNPVFPDDPAKREERNRLLKPITNIDADSAPNVVLILADDLGYGDLSVHGSTSIPTPHIDALAENGVRMTDAYVTAASCSPSRAGLLTGRYQQRYGFEFNTSGAAVTHRAYRGLDPAAITLADVLQRAGYRTGMFGKWHLGTRRHLHPQARGFDEFYGFLAGAHSFFPAKQEEPVPSSITRGYERITEPEYLTDAIARETVRFIEANHEEPFFAYVPFNAVHTPIEATKKYQDRFPDVTDPKRRDYYAMTSALDDAVGRIVAAIERQRLTERTIVIFLNDNGGPIYTGVQSNGELKLGKLFLFEGGIRVPMIVKWPGVLDADTVYRKTVSAMDLFPTVCAAAGVAIHDSWQLDGVDLRPFLRGEIEAAPHETLHWSNGPNAAIRHGDWKLVRSHDNIWLFDLGKDLGERENLAESHPAMVKELLNKHRDWKAGVAKPAWPSKPNRREVQVDGLIYELNI